MRRSFCTSFFLMLLLSTASTGCASVPQTHYYVLDLEGPTPQIPPNMGARPGLQIGVETFLVDPPYDQDRIVYRADPGSAEIGFYAYHRWAVPLSHMLPHLVAKGLLGTPGVALIEPVMPGRSYQASLEGRLLSLDEIDTPQGYQASVRLALTLRLQDGTLLWSDTLVGEATTQTDTVPAVVEQMSVALAAALDRGRDRLASALEGSDLIGCGGLC